MSECQQESLLSIPDEFRAEHPANPFHAIDTRKAEFGPDAQHEIPGSTRRELKRLVCVKTSDWTDAGDWEAHTPSEIRRLEDERKAAQLKHPQSTTAAAKKRNKKKAKRAKIAADHRNPTENELFGESYNRNVNPEFNPDTSNLSMRDSMHPDRVKKRAKRSRPQEALAIPPEISEYIQTPYKHTTPEFIKNLEPVTDRPIAPRSLVPPYPYPWVDIRMSANRYGSEGELNTESFKLKGRAKIFDGFFGISKAQAELREHARLAGKVSWRFTGKEKIIEVFFHIDLEEEKGSVQGTPMNEALQAAEGFEELLPDKSYLAVDKNLVPIVAFYHDAYERAWGKEYGRYIVKMTTKNIDKVARFVKPQQQMDMRRHKGYQAWIEEEENQQFSWASGPDARSGIYYFGLKGELGHSNLKPGLTKDSQGNGMYSGSLVRNLQVWCGNITQTLDACFAGVDRELRDAYRQAFATTQNAGDRIAAQTFEEELFAYRALLINVLTEPHVDHNDWSKGWAWLTPFGDYTGALFCIPLLQRKIPFQPGSVMGIRGERVEHFTTKWRGSNRYSWVFTFPEDLRKNGC
ncbi:hypothetical protein FN846DRAFT_1018584 [Sphaerosporella brunnea]|uniref:Uncharacterized protein n=1 Tax=Sphaerosporella brunnea TaxID=1250544 RepID=A0A5J5F9R3_9PEZI|nr:hypothetical protein FN846DRAFT_1018584 [Sphaerosporella brunnea]